jgi:hypothetical protein
MKRSILLIVLNIEFFLDVASKGGWNCQGEAVNITNSIKGIVSRKFDVLFLVPLDG